MGGKEGVRDGERREGEAKGEGGERGGREEPEVGRMVEGGERGREGERES